jgi:S-DNA-T family DNA segregation ATPase FtsK/SpoIIIE
MKPRKTAATKAAPPKPEGRSLASDLLGVTWIFVTLFLLLALLSYSPVDAIEGHAVRNWAGIVGHWPAHLLVSGFGISAFPVAVLPAMIGVSIIRRRPLGTKIIQFLGFLLLVGALAGFAELTFESVRFRGSIVDAGGALGASLGRLGAKYAGVPGAFLSFGLIFLAGFVIATNISVITLLNALRWISVQIGKTGFKGGRFFAEWLTKRMEQKRRHKEFLLREAQKPKVPAAQKPVKTPRPVYEDDPSTLDEPPPPPRKPKVEKVEIRQREAPKIQQQLNIAVKSGKFEIPKLDFLQYKESNNKNIDRKSLEFNSRLLEKKLADFGVTANVVAVQPGPVVTMYELEPAPGVKVSKFTNLDKDLAMAMKAVSIRVVAPIPGKNVVGIEIPNNEREAVYLKEIIGSPEFTNPKLRIPLALGKNISGDAVVSDLAQCPHLLVAGSTGSGKSVSINAMICSMLYRFTPEQLKFVMIDPKMIELSAYDGIPHLRTPVITNPKKAAIALKRCVDEMERRYELMKVVGRAKDLETYNRRVDEEIKAKGQASVTLRFGDGENAVEETVELARLPYWVIIIDELADLMMVAKKDIEDSIARLTAKARAAGLHLIVATQRPSVDVITGVIKSNLPTRLSFQVASATDSRTILDASGADNLLGQGDSLFIPPKSSRIDRVHGAYVGEEEIAEVVEFLRKQGIPEYDEGLTKAKPGEDPDAKGGGGEDGDSEKDAMYQEVVAFVMESKRASTSAIQRKFKIGYNRAARILDQMQDEGLVGPPNGSNPREILG